MSKKRVFIIGGYFDYFQSGVEAGYELLVVLPPERTKDVYPHSEITYYFHDIYDYENVLKIAKEEHSRSPLVASISFYEPTLIGASKIGHELGINSYPLEIVENIRNKVKVREILNKSGFEKIQFCEVNKRGDVVDLLQKVGRIILKPAGGVGSRQVRAIDNPHQIDQYLTEVKKQNEKFIVEEFIEGEEFCAEGISINGEHTLLAFTERFTTMEPYFMEVGHLQPGTNDKPLIEKLTVWLNELYSSLGHVVGPTHTEFKIKKDKSFALIEAHLRPGGGSIWEMTRHTSGLDLIAITLNALAEDEIRPFAKIPALEPIGGAATRHISCKPGLVTGIDFQVENLSETNPKCLIKLYPAYNIGEIIPDMHESRLPQVGGYTLVFDRERDYALNKSKEISDAFNYIVE